LQINELPCHKFVENKFVENRIAPRIRTIQGLWRKDYN